MGMSDSSTTSTTGSADPNVTSTLDKLLGSGNGVQGLFDAGPTYKGPGATTTGAQAGSIAAAGNPDYMSGVTGALANQSGVASGQNVGTSDPTYQALRAKAGNDALGLTNQAFNGSGLFGTNANQRYAGEGVTNALDSLDLQQMYNGQQQQQQAIGNLPGLFSALQAPSATVGAVGSAQDQASQDQANQKLTLLGQLTQNLGVGSLGGTSSTQPATPWWQSALGLGIGLA